MSIIEWLGKNSPWAWELKSFYLPRMNGHGGHYVKWNNPGTERKPGTLICNPNNAHLKEVESRIEAYQTIGEVGGRRDQKGLIRHTMLQ